MLNLKTLCISMFVIILTLSIAICLVIYKYKSIKNNIRNNNIIITTNLNKIRGQLLEKNECLSCSLIYLPEITDRIDKVIEKTNKGEIKYGR